MIPKFSLHKLKNSIERQRADTRQAIKNVMFLERMQYQASRRQQEDFPSAKKDQIEIKIKKADIDKLEKEKGKPFTELYDQLLEEKGDMLIGEENHGTYYNKKGEAPEITHPSLYLAGLRFLKNGEVGDFYSFISNGTIEDIIADYGDANLTEEKFSIIKTAVNETYEDFFSMVFYEFHEEYGLTYPLEYEVAKK